MSPSPSVNEPPPTSDQALPDQASIARKPLLYLITPTSPVPYPAGLCSVVPVGILTPVVPSNLIYDSGAEPILICLIFDISKLF